MTESNLEARVHELECTSNLMRTVINDIGRAVGMFPDQLVREERGEPVLAPLEELADKIGFPLYKNPEFYGKGKEEPELAEEEIKEEKDPADIPWHGGAAVPVGPFATLSEALEAGDKIVVSMKELLTNLGIDPDGLDDGENTPGTADAVVCTEIGIDRHNTGEFRVFYGFEDGSTETSGYYDFHGIAYSEAMELAANAKLPIHDTSAVEKL